MLQADEARKALSNLPARLPMRLFSYIAIRNHGESALLRESIKWLHAIHGDPVTGKDKRTIRRELGFGRQEEATLDSGIDPSQMQEGDVDMRDLQVDVTIEDPARHGMPLTYLDGLSDIEVSATSQIVKDHVAVVRWEVNGTHSGELLGVAPTHTGITLAGITWIKFEEKPKPEGGRDMWATDEWTFWDLPSLMGQIGATP